jgi:hypothetical protein
VRESKINSSIWVSGTSGSTIECQLYSSASYVSANNYLCN